MLFLVHGFIFARPSNYTQLMLREHNIALDSDIEAYEIHSMAIFHRTRARSK